MGLIKEIILEDKGITLKDGYCKVKNIMVDYKKDDVSIVIEIWASKEKKDEGFQMVSIDHVNIPAKLVDGIEGENYISKIYKAIKSSAPGYANATDDLEIKVDEQPAIKSAAV